MKPEKEDSTLINRSLTRDADETLQRLSGEASDYIGRKVSESAVMRALLRQAEQQKHEWVTSQLCPLIEEELASGVMWGKKEVSYELTSQGRARVRASVSLSVQP